MNINEQIMTRFTYVLSFINKDDPQAETRFQEVSKAYEVLKDEDKQADYDQLGHKTYEASVSGGGGQDSGQWGGNPFQDLGDGGVDCNWMDTREVLIVTPAGSNQVDPEYADSEIRLEKWLSKNPSKGVLATGFIASTPTNIPTTLKRDGSDFSAIMGALFRARQVTIWTDVDGVYSGDPRKVSEAVILNNFSYQEAWEMLYFGANVFHPRTIIPVMTFQLL